MLLSFEELSTMLLLRSTSEAVPARALLWNAIAFMAVPLVLQAGLGSAVRRQDMFSASSVLSGNAGQQADRAVAL